MLLLNELITELGAAWQLHNCKLTQAMLVHGVKLPYRTHYSALPEALQRDNPLDLAALKQMEHLLTAQEFADKTGIMPPVAWGAKYVAHTVLFYEPLLLAIRVSLSNTAKPVQPIYSKDGQSAWAIAAAAWRAFGVVDVLYKGGDPLMVSDGEATLTIDKAAHFWQLPPDFSQAILADLDCARGNFALIERAILEKMPSDN